MNTFKSNIDQLYALGMRNLVIALETAPNATNSPVLQLAAGGNAGQLAVMDQQLTTRQQAVINLLNSQTWPGLKIQVQYSSDYLGKLLSFPTASVGTYPNLNTQADLGFWPLSADLPKPQSTNLPFIDEYHHSGYTDKRFSRAVDNWLLSAFDH